mmetsp:Transcript_13703/g.41714  ORF Transcript_13703/g.41714 Transcript_13703/m.41714 type:complete len:146 (-) Transcript_13703:2109-2546(-)
MAMHNAASIAGLTVLSLMHENTAFAFKYGFDKESEFSTEKDTNVVFYNLGAASYQVSLVSFSSVMGKKNKTTGSLTVRSVAHDDALGGRLFDQAVLNILADEFTKQYPKVNILGGGVEHRLDQQGARYRPDAELTLRCRHIFCHM